MDSSRSMLFLLFVILFGIEMFMANYMIEDHIIKTCIIIMNMAFIILIWLTLDKINSLKINNPNQLIKENQTR